MTRVLLAIVASTLLAVIGCSGGASGKGAVTLNVALRGPHYRLPNGLEVVLHPDRTLRNVAISVRYHVGGKDDPEGRSGFAHLYEHLMFLGSRHVGAGGFSQALDDAAALEYNAYTTQDETTYYEVLPPAQVPVGLWLEADRMAHPIERLDEQSFRREREVVKNEWRERYDDKPYGHLPGIVRGAVFPEGHPYHRPPIGSVADLDRASLSEARAFAARHYVPSNATLVVVGDFDVAEVRPIVDRLFSGIAPGEPQPQRTFEAVRLTKDRRVVVEADVNAPRVIVAWPTPPPHAHGWYELQFAGSLIAGMTAHKLQTEQTAARDVDFRITPGRLGSLLQIDVTLEPGVSADTAVGAIETRLKWTTRIDRSPGYEWPDFVSSRTQRMTNVVLSLSDLSTRAESIQEYLDYFGTPDAAQTHLRRIQAVRAADTAIAAEELLSVVGKAVVVVVPKRGAPRSGRVVQ